jgi:phosphoglycolate phosphatase-like HAD superfamily hydrolase
MSTPRTRPERTSLESFEKQHDTFVGIDSDGCVFDSMEIKHKECFCPAFVNHFGLQAASRYARDVWEFVNLYSQTRGINRFKAILRALDLCRSHREIARRKVDVVSLPDLEAWVAHESKLGNPQLEAEIDRSGSEELRRVMAWSRDVNEAIAKIVRDVPPFPGVVESLERMQGHSDVIVVSQTPSEALVREWAEQQIDGYVSLIAGQELGTKGDHLAATAGGRESGRYAPDRVLMIGDAPGDLHAAEMVGALFYPVLPGDEETSWDRFADEALDRFYAGTYAGQYQDDLIREFEAVLPEAPDWEADR